MDATYDFDIGTVSCHGKTLVVGVVIIVMVSEFPTRGQQNLILSKARLGIHNALHWDLRPVTQLAEKDPITILCPMKEIFQCVIAKGLMLMETNDRVVMSYYA
jgi:hypothetical protein